jgi:hypothetical protein
MRNAIVIILTLSCIGSCAIFSGEFEREPTIPPYDTFFHMEKGGSSKTPVPPVTAIPEQGASTKKEEIVCTPPDTPILAICINDGHAAGKCRYYTKQAKPPTNRYIKANIIIEAETRRYHSAEKDTSYFDCKKKTPEYTLWCVGETMHCLYLEEVPPPKEPITHQRIDIRRFIQIKLEYINDKNRIFVPKNESLFIDDTFGHTYRVAPPTT